MAEYIDKNVLRKHLLECYTDEFFDADLKKAVVGIDVYVEKMPAADVQPVKRGKWIENAEEYYRLWQDSGRSWDDMPYFVTGLKFACSCCFNQYDVNAEGVEEWDFCPNCGARMNLKDGDTE